MRLLGRKLREWTTIYQEYLDTFPGSTSEERSLEHLKKKAEEIRSLIPNFNFNPLYRIALDTDKYKQLQTCADPVLFVTQEGERNDL